MFQALLDALAQRITDAILCKLKIDEEEEHADEGADDKPPKKDADKSPKIASHMKVGEIYKSVHRQLADAAAIAFKAADTISTGGSGGGSTSAGGWSGEGWGTNNGSNSRNGRNSGRQQQGKQQQRGKKQWAKALEDADKPPPKPPIDYENEHKKLPPPAGQEGGPPGPPAPPSPEPKPPQGSAPVAPAPPAPGDPGGPAGPPAPPPNGFEELWNAIGNFLNNNGVLVDPPPDRPPQAQPPGGNGTPPTQPPPDGHIPPWLQRWILQQLFRPPRPGSKPPHGKPPQSKPPHNKK